ncbi:MAG TPA: ester cyclase [Burkholderiales bacterium]|nr:ester cyclase [Burkholderiales bacterium]
MKRIALSLIAALLLAPAAWAGNSAKEEANKKLVVDFYDRVLNKKDVDAVDRYVGPYRQHNPMAADGPEGLKGFIQYLKQNAPQAHFEFKRVLADGDFVILHVHAVMAPGTRGMAIVDLFKVDQGRIVEHWDVIQDIPEKSANANTMF